MQTKPTIEAVVMRRVRTIHALKTVAGPAGKAALLFVALVVIGSQVSVTHVFANMAANTNPTALVRFFTAAFTHTVFLVQAASVVALLALLWLLRDLLAGNRDYAHARA